MAEPTNPLDPDTPTGHVEQPGRETNSSPDVTQESPGGSSVVPGASGTAPTSPTAFARLWRRCGRRDEARDVLAAVYGTYTEGFTTPDLVEANVLLERLAETV